MKNHLNRVPKPTKRRSTPSMKERKAFSKEVKERAMAYWGGKCAECENEPAADPHHIRPRSDGGKGVFTNCLPVCRSCHDLIEQSPRLQMKWREWAKERWGFHYWADDQDLFDMEWQKIAKFEERGFHS